MVRLLCAEYTVNTCECIGKLPPPPLVPATPTSSLRFNPVPENVGEFLHLPHIKGKRKWGELQNMLGCQRLARNATTRGETGVLDTRVGRNIWVHFPEPTSAASSSSAHGRQQPAEKIDVRVPGKFCWNGMQDVPPRPASWTFILMERSDTSPG